jgi:hypothetical protein
VAVSLVPQHGTGWATLAPVFIAGLGGGTVLAPNQSLTLAAVPLPEAGAAGGLACLPSSVAARAPRNEALLRAFLP